MKKAILTISGVLFMATSMNASDEIDAYAGCHGMVDILMSNLVAAGAFDGNLSQAVEDWVNLYDTCDTLENLL
ncbi:hypothetical protein LCL86_07295 [Muricauda ruestringensis]|uniref:hypothetical protein n=1 Tax=Flagellimonas ruestringensis TaxID=111501 RepID=UPI001CD37FC5|nr:hypothetical protein [Allomuricauda ruestringensis]MCA0958838.1 hypothetical protein [Allomuricauda ruestringensis]